MSDPLRNPDAPVRPQCPQHPMQVSISPDHSRLYCGEPGCDWMMDNGPPRIAPIGEAFSSRGPVRSGPAAVRWSEPNDPADYTPRDARGLIDPEAAAKQHAEGMRRHMANNVAQAQNAVSRYYAARDTADENTIKQAIAEHATQGGYMSEDHPERGFVGPFGSRLLSDALQVEADIRRENPHKNPDPMTGNCLDCGATRENMDDNIAPTCEKISGPHRVALLALVKTRRFHVIELAHLRRNLEMSERSTVQFSHTIREGEAQLRELDAAIARLKGE